MDNITKTLDRGGWPPHCLCEAGVPGRSIKLESSPSDEVAALNGVSKAHCRPLTVLDSSKLSFRGNKIWADFPSLTTRTLKEADDTNIEALYRMPIFKCTFTQWMHGQEDSDLVPDESSTPLLLPLSQKWNWLQLLPHYFTLPTFW